jgi:hypothetical protein
MEYATWEAEPMGPSVQTGFEQPQMTQQAKPQQMTNPLQQPVMQQMPLGNGTPAVSAPPAIPAQTRQVEQARPKTVPVAVVGSAAAAYAITQPSLKNIGFYGEMSDLWYIFAGVLVVEAVVIILTRYYPETLGMNLNRWYSSFGLSAVLADVLIIVIGFLLARYVYTNYVEPSLADRSWSPWIFIATLVGIQLVHDIFFYKGVIQTVGRGTNSMIDLFKDYAEVAGAKILAGDAAMMVGSAVIAMILKGQPEHLTGFVGILAAYVIPYILHTKAGGGGSASD